MGWGSGNLGGGVGSSAKLPAIYVQYPEGSICTCTNGEKTYTAKDTTGFWLFAGLSIGTWTVTTTAPTGENRPVSETVEITTEGQILSVKLSYWNGLIYDYETGFALPFVEKTFSYTALPAGQGYIDFTEQGILMRNSDTATGTLQNIVTSLCTEDPIDLSKFTTANITFEFTSDNGGNDPRFCITNANSGDMANNANVVVSRVDMPKTGTYSIDLSAINDSYYVMVAVSNVQAITVKKMWLE